MSRPVAESSMATSDRRRWRKRNAATSKVHGKVNAVAETAAIQDEDGVAVTFTDTAPVAGFTDCEPMLQVTPAGALHAKENALRNVPTGDAVTENVAGCPRRTVMPG